MKHLLVTVTIVFAMAITSKSADAAIFDLQPGEYIFAGYSLQTPECYYRVTLQTDGNLVIYDPYGRAMWASGTNGSGAAYATMQTDGNFVLYRWDGSAVWATGTNGWGGSQLKMQSDGNLVVYWGSWAIWASGYLGNPGLGTSNCPATRTTGTNWDIDRPGGDYTNYLLLYPKPLWCAYYCAEDSRCKTYAYVPPGYQGPTARCYLKDSVPPARYAPGFLSGVVDNGR